ncbi:sulfotransferase [Halanaerobacter jeridensis]
MNSFNQHSVFISSTGRTGTQFLAWVMSEMITDCTSIHEPGTPWLTKLNKLPKQIKRYGLYHMTWGQLQPSHSMFKLSTDRCRGVVSDKQAKEYIRNMREGLMKQLDSGVYVESSGHMYGALDLLDEVFPNSKIVFIIRDPRNFVRSALNTLEYILYGPLDIDCLDLSLKARYLDDDPYSDKWSSMSKFEKYCWYYNYLNEFVFSKLEGADNFKVYRFEDLFNPETRDDYFTDMLQFSSTFQDGYTKEVNYQPELMDQKVHSNAKKKKFPKWLEWSPKRAQILQKHCGKWMDKFDYGTEKEWQDKL